MSCLGRTNLWPRGPGALPSIFTLSMNESCLRRKKRFCWECPTAHTSTSSKSALSFFHPFCFFLPTQALCPASLNFFFYRLSPLANGFIRSSENWRSNFFFYSSSSFGNNELDRFSQQCNDLRQHAEKSKFVRRTPTIRIPPSTSTVTTPWSQRGPPKASSCKSSRRTFRRENLNTFRPP